MLAWTGQGWLGFLIVFGAIIGVESAFEGGRSHGYLPQVLTFLAAAVPCWLLGRLLNRDAPRKFFDLPHSEIDPETKEPRHYGSSGHTLAFVRLEYAGLFVIVYYFAVWLGRLKLFRF